MSSSKERFSIPNLHLKIERWKDATFIPIPNMFFAGRRNTLRGLEEWIAKRRGEEDHDYVNGTYVYKLIDDEDNSIFVKFESNGSFIVGSNAIYGGY